MSVFTIGNTEVYDAALARGHAGDGMTPVKKTGPHKRPDGSQYYGGYAFATVNDALAYIDKLGKNGEWSVYEMEAVWPDDTYHGHPTDDFMRLNRDAVVLRRVADSVRPESESAPPAQRSA